MDKLTPDEMRRAKEYYRGIFNTPEAEAEVEKLIQASIRLMGIDRFRGIINENNKR